MATIERITDSAWDALVLDLEYVPLRSEWTVIVPLFSDFRDLCEAVVEFRDLHLPSIVVRARLLAVYTRYIRVVHQVSDAIFEELKTEFATCSHVALVCHRDHSNELKVYVIQ